ncbi:hypothetical protein PRK78_003503 [Emydomyces testavorans]|uniref:Nucleoporin Nup159/Nup146 N-terminal domain-containing protein n=1 Tax=Emydomyces testavorans TaxID=2070801 RepID=A0AAF0DG60_9EURO|nr:hypothetical protein PRK78_003503 [Emydomyces testavorans]
MAFSFGGGSQSPMGSGKVQLGPELQEIQTQSIDSRSVQEVGFLSLNGDSKIRLLPSPWPADALPPPTSSLLSVASTKSLLAAAGPDGIVVASTDSVRKAFFAEATGESNIRPFQPELQIPLPGRVSHVAFSADDSALVVAAQNGDGLAVYDVSALLQGTTQPAVTISLNGESLRALCPNPVAPELFAAITTNGELIVANLKTGQLEGGPNGPVLKTRVSSVSWSTKGKQLVAGLADGGAYQMTPKGEGKAEIPSPPGISGNQHVSSLMWLENNLFLMIYTPTVFSDDRPSSSYYIVTRHPPDRYEFQKLPEVCSPFGLERHPSFQFTGRLKKFEPDLKEVLVVASTASTDIGLFTRSTKPFAGDCPPEKITDVFTTTTMSEDSRRAEVPMTEDMTDTSPIGLAIDFSSKDKVPSPIPGEDIKESATPLPMIMILNNDGVLSSWWFVYSESIRQQKPYHGLSVIPQPSLAIQQQAAPKTAAIPETPKPAFGPGVFGQPAFGQPSFGKPATPAFGAATPLGANRQPTFGSPTALGDSRPAFGSTTPMGGGVSFGTPSVPGQRGPEFGQSTSITPGRSLFGLTSAQAPHPGSAGGGFSSFAVSGGFGGVLASHTPEQSPFAKAAAENPFAKAGQPVFGTPSSDAFSKKESTQSASGGLASGGFVLGSTFTPDATAAMDEDKPEKPNGTISLGSFGKSLDFKDDNKPSPDAKPKSSLFASPFLNITDTKPPASPKSPFGPPTTGLFGKPQQRAPVSTPPESGTLATSFSQPSPTTVSKPTKSPPLVQEESSLSETTVKVETPSDTQVTPSPKLAEPPLPPEPTSRADYGPGDTSASSSNISRISFEEAPLPPDFLPPKKLAIPKEAERSPEPESPQEPESPKEPTLPESPEHHLPALPDESEVEKAEGEGFEDSGEEVTHEASSIDFKVSPESSFGGVSDKSPTGERFTKISAPKSKPAVLKPLFGEITETPIFSPPQMPKDRARISPRSPSPVRNQRRSMLSMPDGLRSTSAPMPGRALSRRKAALESSMLAKQITAPSEDIADEASVQEVQRQAERLVAEAQELVEDEDEQLRRDLARPLSPAPTLDPFLPHQDYNGESLKPGIPGQIERLYRDINAMVGTLGINARSLSSYLLYQQSAKNLNDTGWIRTLRSEKYADVLDEKLLLSEIPKLQKGVEALDQSLQQGKIEDIQDKLEKCHQLFNRDLVSLRGQCASIRKTLDSYADAVAIASAPLSAEQSALQQDLRKISTEVQVKLADLEKDISLLRAKIADCSKPGNSLNGQSRGTRRHMGRPTVEAVTSTINTMTNMAQKKSGDIDVLEAQMRKLGIDISGSAPQSREASPFSTPLKKTARLPITPGSRTSLDGGVRSSYHTPESNRTSKFRSSVLSQSALRTSNGPTELVLPEDSESWKAKAQRRKEVVGHLKAALSNRKGKVRSLDVF